MHLAYPLSRLLRSAWSSEDEGFSSQRFRSLFLIFSTGLSFSLSWYVTPAALRRFSTISWSGVGTDPPTVSSPLPGSLTAGSKSPPESFLVLDFLSFRRPFLKDI